MRIREKFFLNYTLHDKNLHVLEDKPPNSYFSGAERCTVKLCSDLHAFNELYLVYTSTRSLVKCMQFLQSACSAREHNMQYGSFMRMLRECNAAIHAPCTVHYRVTLTAVKQIQS